MWILDPGDCDAFDDELLALGWRAIPPAAEGAHVVASYERTSWCEPLDHAILSGWDPRGAAPLELERDTLDADDGPNPFAPPWGGGWLGEGGDS